MRGSTHAKIQLESSESSPVRDVASLEKLSPEQYWLSLQCQMLQDINCGRLFRVSADGRNARLDACWPKLVVAEDGMLRKVLLCAEYDKPYRDILPAEADAPEQLRLYQPVKARHALFVVVLDMQARSGAEQRTVVNILRWNSEWLAFSLATRPREQHQDVMVVLSIAAAALEQRSFRGAGTALVTELAARFGCRRVSLGLRHGKRMHVELLSHSAQLKQETDLIRAIAGAMDEAADQDRPVIYPPPSDSPHAITHAHEALAAQMHGSCVCSIPLSDGGEIVGALTLERDGEAPLDDYELRQIEQVTALVAPALWLKRADEQGLHRKAGRSLSRFMADLLGRGHVRLKLSAVFLVAALLFAWFAQGDWRVSADAVVEGRVQRTVAAPIDGYIASADARAGDVVSAGQQIGSLDDSDLRLQRLKWTTLRQQMISELRDARARNSRAEVSIITAKIEQANAELELVDEQLARTRLVAPFDGVLIEGDLSQLLGTPVQRGEQLFRVAPLDDYRIVLRVDERDVAAVKPGMSGRLVLASLPAQPIELEVTRVTPVSTPAEGRNVFRVEARLSSSDQALQPGMEGVGKITVGEARLVWIWTRDLVNWLRLQTWTWWR